jgi:uncharacterized membrane protein YbhN (UPF0104 family)
MKLLLRVVVSVGVLTLLFLLLPWHEVRGALSRMSPGVWGWVLAGFIGGHLLGTVKWRVLVNAGRSSLALVDAFRCYAAGLFANICLPSIVGGDVLRAVLAGKATGRPEAVVLGGLADRVIDTAAMMLLVAVGGFFVRGALPGWGTQLLTFGLVLGAVVGILFLPMVLRRPLRRWPRKVRRPVGRALVALRRLTARPSAAVIAVLISLTVQSSFVLLNAWIGHSIGVRVPIGAWFLAWSLAKLAGLLPISLGGLGVRDATLGALLVPFGVSISQGVVTSLIWQSVLIAGGLFGGAIWWLLGRRLPAARADAIALPVT